VLGWPNAGKSSLFNALCGRAGALVSHHPGTTRDYLTAELDLDGVRCRLVDTAGIETEPCGEDNDVCLAAQTATAEKEKHARVHILCLDGSRPPNTWERAEVDRGTECRRLVAWTKADLGRQHDFLPHALRTSSATGEGLVALAARVREAIRETGIEGEDMVPGTAARCRESLRMASACLRRALGLVETRAGEELVAAEVRGALDELGKVVGAVHTEDVLERVFSRFCVGK